MRHETEGTMNLGLPSGPWRCRWVQGHRSEIESLSLTFTNGRVQGTGVDADGFFEYVGSVYADGSLSLTKTYAQPFIPVPPALSYIGRWDGRCASGQWIDDQDPTNNGPFRMWPGHGPEPSLEAHRTKTFELSVSPDGRELVPVRTPKESSRGGRDGH